MTKTTRPSFSVNTSGKFYNKLAKNLVGSLERKVGPFIEVIDDDGSYTYRVDFRLGGGYYHGWLITEMIKDEAGIESLQWLLSRDFPVEVKKHILKLMVKHDLIDESTLEQLESMNDEE